MIDLHFELNGERFSVQAEAVPSDSGSGDSGSGDSGSGDSAQNGLAQNSYQVRIGERVYSVNGRRQANGRLEFTVDGSRHVAYTSGVDDSPQTRLLWLDGHTWPLTRVDGLVDGQTPRRGGQAPPASGSLSAAMPGQVRDILVSVGDVVAAGDALLILEAMKMEMRMSAPADGTVAHIHCAVGDVVTRGQVLIEMEG